MKDVQSKINEALNNALDNGYDIFSWTDEAIATDLGTYDSGFDGWEVEKLLPYIKSWRMAKAKSWRENVSAPIRSSKI